MPTRDELSSDYVLWTIGLLHSMHRNWRVALGGLISAGLVVAIIIYTLPNKYRSQASLPLSTNVRALITSSLFLKPIAKEHLPNEFERSPDVAITSLRNSLGIPREFERSSNVYRIDVVWDNDPKKAKEILTSIVNESLKWSRPTGSNRETQLEQIAMLEANIPNLRKIYDRFLIEPSEDKMMAQTDRIPTTLLAIENDISEKEAKLKALKRSLDGFSRDDVVEWPSDPEKQGGKLASAAAAGMAVIFLTMVLLYFLYQHEENRRAE